MYFIIILFCRFLFSFYYIYSAESDTFPPADLISIDIDTNRLRERHFSHVIKISFFLLKNIFFIIVKITILFFYTLKILSTKIKLD